MSQIKTLNGVQYTLPQYSDTGWGANTGNVLTQYMAAIADVTLQLSGGSFTLTADTNFGATFGLISAYFTSRTANAASAGAVRLAKTDVVSWRNNVNGADIDLSKDTSDNLKWNATKILLSGAVVNADINAAAAIAYSKLNLAASIVNADIAVGAAIAYSKLALTTSIVNGDVAVAAAIALSKLAALSNSIVPVTNGSGVITSSAVTATELGYVSGVTSAIQTQLAAKASLALDNLASVAINTALLPGADNSIGLGSAAKRWTSIFGKDIDCGASGTAGTLDVYPTTAAKGKIQVTAADSAGDTTTTIVNASQAGARTYTIPDAGASASFVMSAGNQTESGTRTFDGQLIGKGTATNDSAAAGYIGEYIASSVASVAGASTGSFKEVTHIDLTPGDWDISCTINMSTAASTTLAAGGENEVVIGTTTASSSGCTFGVDRFIWDWQNSFTPGSKNPANVSIARKRVTISGNTTYYLNAFATYGTSTISWSGTISARRMR